MLTARLANLLDYASAEAKRHGHDRVEPRHLAAALHRMDPDGFTAALGHDAGGRLTGLLEPDGSHWGRPVAAPETVELLEQAAASGGLLQVADALRPLLSGTDDAGSGPKTGRDEQRGHTADPSIPATGAATHYATLGVDPGADHEACRHGYLLRAQLLHPDRHAEASAEVQDAATRAMQELNEAWAVIGDPDRRRRYDLGLADPQPPSGPDPAPTSPWREPGPGECRFCGSTPAVPVTIRCETGMLLRRKRSWVDGPFCRECGLSAFRGMTNRTLIRGWWGLISFFANILTVLNNTAVWWRLRPLAAPTSTPGVRAARDRPLGRGRPLVARAGVWVAAAVCAFVVAGIVQSNRTPPAGAPARVSSNYDLGGKCLVLSADGQRIQNVVDCGQSHNARIVSVVASSSLCPNSATEVFSSADVSGVLCVSPGY